MRERESVREVILLVFNPFMQDRMMRIKLVTKILGKQLPILYSKALSLVTFNTGASESKSKEYIRIACDLEGWKIVNGEIIGKRRRKSIR